MDVAITSGEYLVALLYMLGVNTVAVLLCWRAPNLVERVPVVALILAAFWPILWPITVFILILTR